MLQNFENHLLKDFFIHMKLLTILDEIIIFFVHMKLLTILDENITNKLKKIIYYNI